MTKDIGRQDPILRELVEIRTLLQSLLIIEGARNGMTRDQVRRLVGVSSKRVSDIWGQLKSVVDE